MLKLLERADIGDDGLIESILLNKMKKDNATTARIAASFIGKYPDQAVTVVAPRAVGLGPYMAKADLAPILGPVSAFSRLRWCLLAHETDWGRDAAEEQIQAVADAWTSGNPEQERKKSEVMREVLRIGPWAARYFQPQQLFSMVTFPAQRGYSGAWRGLELLVTLEFSDGKGGVTRTPREELLSLALGALSGAEVSLIYAACTMQPEISIHLLGLERERFMAEGVVARVGPGFHTPTKAANMGQDPSFA